MVPTPRLASRIVLAPGGRGACLNREDSSAIAISAIQTSKSKSTKKIRLPSNNSHKVATRKNRKASDNCRRFEWIYWRRLTLGRKEQSILGMKVYYMVYEQKFTEFQGSWRLSFLGQINSILEKIAFEKDLKWSEQCPLSRASRFYLASFASLIFVGAISQCCHRYESTVSMSYATWYSF